MVATSRRTASPADRVEALLLGLAFVFLGLACLALTLAPAVRPGGSVAGTAGFAHWSVLPVWLLAVGASRAVMRRRLSQRDPVLFPVAMLLAGWGVLLIWRLTPGFGIRQLAWLGLSTIALSGLMLLPRRLGWLRSYRYLWLGLGLLLTALTLVFGTHPSGGSPRLWLGCCGVYFQPSEMLRLLLVVFFASYLADRIQFGWRRDRPSLVATLAPLLAVWGLSTLLVLAQRDLGSGMMLLALLTALLYLASGRWEVILVSLLLGAVGAGAAAATSSVVGLRLAAWVNPWQDPLGGSYQIVQSLIALASGGVLGSGPGLGAPGFVPVAHSDFIFASIAEEWGLGGAVGLLALMAIFVGRGLRIGAGSPDPFHQMLAGGLAVNLGLQAMFILAGVLRVLPLTGITLPYVSYGGTSLLSSFLSLGLLLVMSNGAAGVVHPRRTFERVFFGFQAAFLVLAMAAGYWMVIRAPAILRRTDNLRRAVEERYSQRGRILDRNGVVLADSEGLPGGFARQYPAAAAANVAGFDSPSYGLMGMEQSMDGVLRGEEGARLLELMQSQALYGYPPPGADVRLTLDLALQTEATSALQGQQGAIVVLDPATGDVLAMASSPSFNPSTLEADWAGMLANPGAPLLNRAVQSSYQPGTAFAPWMVAWAIEHRDARLGQIMSDIEAPFSLNGLELTCARPALGASLGQALQAGCPAPLAALGRQMGGQSVEAAGLALAGEGTPIDRSGDPGTPEAMEMTEALSVGQGWLTLTPIAMARAWAATVGGPLPPVRVVDAVSDAHGNWLAWPFEQEQQPVFSPETARLMSRTLTQTGDAGPSFSGVAIAGADQGRVAWYLARAGDDSAPVVAVVLEQSDLESAEQVGGRVVRAVRRLASP